MGNPKMSVWVCFSALLFAGVSFAQEPLPALPVDEKTGLITYREVVEIEGAKSDLFNWAVYWINEYYKNPADVTKVRDAETGEIKGVHRLKIRNTAEDGSQTDAGLVQYNFAIELKDNRYRCTLNEFVLRQSSKIPVEKWMNREDPQYNPLWDQYLAQIDEFATSWIQALKEGMKPPAEDNDDDW
ncbi:MAG: DUF4468 domain-containing protein [Bacteroidales bacterium]|nr:DUF4468 domain-containing protein [Bacteroidales bacterium]